MSDFDDRLAEWWSSPPYEGVYVETLTISHPSFTDSIRIVNGLRESLLAADENGQIHEYLPFPFQTEEDEIGRSTKQEFSFVIDGIDGAIYDALKLIDLSDLSSEPTVSLRVYLYPEAVDAPLITPPPKFILKSATVTRNLCALLCKPSTFPNKRAGYLYTVEEFIGLILR